MPNYCDSYLRERKLQILNEDHLLYTVGLFIRDSIFERLPQIESLKTVAGKLIAMEDKNIAPDKG